MSKEIIWFIWTESALFFIKFYPFYTQNNLFKLVFYERGGEPCGLTFPHSTLISTPYIINILHQRGFSQTSQHFINQINNVTKGWKHIYCKLLKPKVERQVEDRYSKTKLIKRHWFKPRLLVSTAMFSQAQFVVINDFTYSKIAKPKTLFQHLYITMPCSQNFSNNISDIIMSIYQHDDVDRISCLPDCILHDILSFLEKKQVQTCVLSKQWKTATLVLGCINIL